MHMSTFDTEIARRDLSLGKPINPAAFAGIVEAMERERETAEQDAREKGESAGYEEAEAELKPEADKAADLADELEKAQDTIEALQDRISELMDGDMRNAMTAKLEALRSELLRVLDGSYTGWFHDARTQKGRDSLVRDLRRSVMGLFASAMPQEERSAAA